VVDSQEITVLGKVTTAHGIKGWVKVYSQTQPMNNILSYGRWLLRVNGKWLPYNVITGRPQSKGLVAQLKGVDDRDSALMLSQCDIGIPTSELPELSNDEHYWFQLENLQVVNISDQLLGQVSKVFNSGAPHDVLKVVACEGSIVMSVDLDEKTIKVDWQADY
jgi:16S rRNA processing protein RimM